MKGIAPKSMPADFELESLAEKITLGGWPGLIGTGGRTALRFMQDYISLLVEVDINRFGGKRREPQKLMRLMQSLARNISTEASLTSLAKDSNGSGVSRAGASDETIAEYLQALERLMVLEQLPAWSPHIRSADTLRKAPKHHFADPSLAVGALKLSTGKLVEDLNYFGFLFESLVIRDLRIYSQVNDGTVYHYRDSRDMEVDAIVEYPDNTWAAFEVKWALAYSTKSPRTCLPLPRKSIRKKWAPRQP
jgi:predicted AAA+ superfamily ATPase